MKSPVYRYEQAGESGIPYPTLGQALRYAPSHAEAQVRTSIEGVVLAEAEPCNGPGTCLVWCTTLAGQSRADESGSWTLQAPTLSPSELDTALALALGEDLERVAS